VLVFHQMQNILFYSLKMENVLYIIVRLSYFTTVCNTHECKKMDQGISRGQLYDVENVIKISEKH
jgi:hypothetical protein